VFWLALEGLTSDRIAQELSISTKTVETHRTRINRKLQCRSTGALVRFAVTNSLLSSP
jgi:DNA-binding CsgD family transcriptional regulator